MITWTRDTGVSQTLYAWATGTGNYMYRMQDICDIQGFDLDDFLFEIWKETRND